MNPVARQRLCLRLFPPDRLIRFLSHTAFWRERQLHGCFAAFYELVDNTLFKAEGAA